MPELPEVETIAALLRTGGPDQQSICGSQVQQAQVLWARTLANMRPRAFCARIAGQTVENVARRGKFVVIPLSQDTLLIHLRMSGDLRVEAALDADGQPRQPEKHDRLLIDFMGGQRLAFNDMRKFGRAWLTADTREVLDRLGPEPLDEALNAERFHGMLNAHNRQLKPLLMDQRFLAGLGNIYTDEALHGARLHPLLGSGQLSLDEAGRLLAAIRAVLNEGIRRNGASIDWVYRGGDFQNYFRVYGRAGQPCLTCGTPITRLVVGQRGTHICPRCQAHG